MNLQTFDVDFAGQYGLEPAILFQAIGYWCKHNSGKPDRNRDGMVWMYMSRREWRVEFPYIGEGTLRTALQKLVDEGLLVIANYSEGMYARTTWYTLTALGWELWLKQPKGSADSAKGFGENSQTITTTHSTTTNNTSSPIGAPKPTKASSRANPRIRLGEFLSHVGGNIPQEWLDWAGREFGWDEPRIIFEREDFLDYWTGPDAAGGGRKADWERTWRGHCRRFAGYKGRGPKPAGSGAGQGGFKRHDHVAAARDSVLAELFGVGPEGHGRPPAAANTEPNPFGDEPEATDAVYVDVTASPETSLQRTAGPGGGGADRADGSPLPLEVQSG